MFTFRFDTVKLNESKEKNSRLSSARVTDQGAGDWQRNMSLVDDCFEAPRVLPKYREYCRNKFIELLRLAPTCDTRTATRSACEPVSSSLRALKIFATLFNTHLSDRIVFTRVSVPR